MQYAIRRRISPAMENCELTFLGRRAIDLVRADEQHLEIARRLGAEGLTVIMLPAQAGLPDSTFTEDTAIVLDEVAIITRPGAVSRQPESESMAALLAHFRPRRWIAAPGTIEGGDVVRVGQTLYVGCGTRTSAAGIASLEEIVAPYGYRVVAVPLAHCLHLKTGATCLGDGTWLVNPAWVEPGSLPGFRILTVPESEPWAANTLCLNGKIYLPAGNQRTEEMLREAGYQVETVVIDELQKAEAGLTCLSVIFGA